MSSSVKAERGMLQYEYTIVSYVYWSILLSDGASPFSDWKLDQIRIETFVLMIEWELSHRLETSIRKANDRNIDRDHWYCSIPHRNIFIDFVEIPFLFSSAESVAFGIHSRTTFLLWKRIINERFDRFCCSFRTKSFLRISKYFFFFFS